MWVIISDRILPMPKIPRQPRVRYFKPSKFWLSILLLKPVGYKQAHSLVYLVWNNRLLYMVQYRKTNSDYVNMFMYQIQLHF